MSELANTSTDVNNIVNGYSSINPTTAVEAARLYTAVSSAKSLKDMVNVSIDVVDVLVQKGTVTTDDGVVEDRLIVTLIDAEGNAYGSNSPTVADGLQSLLIIMGEPGTKFWGKSLALTPKLLPSSQGRSFLSLALTEVKK